MTSEARSADHAAGGTRGMIAELQARLAEAEATLQAIRSGEVDAITVATPAGPQVFSLKGAEQPYREMIEAMSEGAVNVAPDGMVLYCNQRFADMTGTDSRTVMGSSLPAYFAPQDRAAIAAVLRAIGITRVRARMPAAGGEPMTVSVAMHHRANAGERGSVITVVSDLTEIMAAQEATAEANRRLECQRAELQASEQRYRLLLETMSEGLIESDALINLSYVNPCFAEMLGYTVPELMGRQATQFVVAGALERMSQRLAERRAGQSEIYELSWIHRDGHEVPTRISSRPHFAADGSYTGATVTVTDLSERRRAEAIHDKAEAERRAADRYARSLIEATPDPLVTINADGAITDANRATEAATGRAREQLIGHDFGDFFTESDKARDGCRTAFAEGGVTDYPLAIRNASGVIMDVLLNARTYHDEAGNVIGVVAAARDITARKEAEAKLAVYQRHLEDLVAERTADLAAANQALNAANQELETFAFSVSHDLRAPLRAIDGFSHVLLEDYAEKLDTDAQRLIGIVRDGVAKMAQLIDDILAFSRAARREVAAIEIDMAGLVQETLTGLAPAMTGRAIEIKVEPLPPVRGDRDMIQRVWMNLLDNAIKFTAHTANARIEVGAYAEAASTVYFVKDNGAGFDMQYVDKLFRVFQRLHGPEDFPGTGAGLAIIKRIVGRHGGRVWAEGKVGEGAGFYFALPTPSPAHV